MIIPNRAGIAQPLDNMTHKPQEEPGSRHE